jgi:hypothetical protein
VLRFEQWHHRYDIQSLRNQRKVHKSDFTKNKRFCVLIEAMRKYKPQNVVSKTCSLPLILKNEKTHSSI